MNDLTVLNEKPFTLFVRHEVVVVIAVYNLIIIIIKQNRILKNIKIISIEMLEELKCSLSEDKHFLINPVPLSECGHSVCKICLPKDGGDSIKCKTCADNNWWGFKQNRGIRDN